MFLAEILTLSFSSVVTFIIAASPANVTITIINNSLIIIYFINKELLVRHNIPICSYRDIKLWLNIMVVNTLWNKRHVFGTNDRKPA